MHRGENGMAEQKRRPFFADLICVVKKVLPLTGEVVQTISLTGKQSVDTGKSP
jgi:hypothetical protein